MGDKLNQALLAVYFHADVRHRPPPFGFEKYIKPIPLDIAVDAVATYSVAASNQRLRCAAKLVTFSQVVDEKLVIEEQAIVNLAKLEIPVEELIIHLNRYFAPIYFPRPIPDSPPTKIPFSLIPPFILEQLVYDFWRTHFRVACVPEILKNSVSFNHYDWTSSVLYRARIPKPFGPSYAAVHDPQNWVTCSDSFGNSFVAAPNAEGDWVDANYDGFPKATRPAAGTSWSDVLFEHFKMELVLDDGAIWETWYRNFLDIRTFFLDTEFSFEYSLKSSIRSYVGPSLINPLPTEIDGGLNLDNGDYRVAVDPADSQKCIIQGYKEVRMAGRGWHDYYYNYWMSIFLMFMADEGARVACECDP